MSRRLVRKPLSHHEDPKVSVTLLEPDLLDCPICCEPLKIPIYMCINGHLACPPCCKRLKNVCPMCQLRIGYNRCRAMEKVIEATRVSCPNAKRGCKEKVPYGVDLSSHEKQCVFAPCSFPVRDCDCTGSHKDLKNHVRAKHKDDMVKFTSRFGFVYDMDLLNDVAMCILILLNIAATVYMITHKIPLNKDENFTILFVSLGSFCFATGIAKAFVDVSKSEEYFPGRICHTMGLCAFLLLLLSSIVSLLTWLYTLVYLAYCGS